MHASYLESMNKLIVPSIIVVEGEGDKAFLSSFIKSYFFVTNGLDISEVKLEFLKLASKRKDIIILTDNDEAGERIRNKINSVIKSAKNVKISGFSRKNYKKTGVAESTQEEIISLLKDYSTTMDFEVINYELNSLVSLSQNPSEIRDQIISKYHLIRGNNKSVENQLNILGITKEELYGNLKK